MNFKEKYINEEILEKIVIPFYKKTFQMSMMKV